MKKVLAITLVAALLFSVAACSALNPEWKQFLKEYEEWVDDYVALYKKYEKNPTDMSLLGEYTAMAAKAAEWSRRADEIEESIKDEKDLAEFTKEYLRITNKLTGIVD